MALGLKYSVFDGIFIFSAKLTPITYFFSCFFFSLIIGIIGVFINCDLEFKIIKIQILIGVIFVFTELYSKLFYSRDLEGLDYWMFEIIFLRIFMSHYLKMEVLSHQKYSLFLCVFFSFILKVISNFLDSHPLEDGTYTNIYNYLYKEYSDQWFPIPLIIVSFILKLIIRAYGNTKLKFSMDILFLSPYTVLMTYGFLGVFFSLMYIILLKLIDFRPLGTINESFQEDNYVSAILSTIIYGIANSFKILFDLLIIRDLSPFHIFVKYKIYYLLIQFILFCFNQKIKNKAFYFVELSSDIICFIGFLIYLELIEIRCLSYGLRKHIIERSEKDVFEALNDERKGK